MVETIYAIIDKMELVKNKDGDTISITAVIGHSGNDDINNRKITGAMILTVQSAEEAVWNMGSIIRIEIPKQSK